MSLPGGQSRWRIYFVCFWGTFLLGAACRYGSDLNFGELHLGLSDLGATDGVRVSCKTLAGQLLPLQVREENSQQFSIVSCPGPLRSLLLYVPAAVDRGKPDIEVRFGEQWGAPSRRVAFDIVDRGVDSRPTGATRVWEVLPANGVSCHLAPIGSCNWQGDFWLISVPLLQAVLAVSILFLLRRLCSLAASANWPQPAGWGSQLIRIESGSLFVWGIAIVRVFLLLMMLWQMFTLAQGFLFVRWGNQFAGFVLMICALAVITGAYVSSIRNAGSDWQRLLICALLMTAVFVVKAWFCLSFDGAQHGDYERYYRYGLAMARGRWDMIGDAGVLTREAFLERSAVFTAPLMRFLGPSLTGLELSLLAMEFTTVVGMIWLMARMFGVTAACCAVPFLLFYPPFVFSTWVVGTTTPGFLWMVLLWCAVEKLVDYFRGRLLYGSRRPGIWTWMVSSVVFCVMLLMLELTRNYGVFVYAAAFVSGAVAMIAVWRAVPRPSLKLVGSLLFISLLTVYLGSAVVRLGRGAVLSEIRKHTGLSPRVSVLDALSAMDSTTDGSGLTISNWRFATMLNLPLPIRAEVLRRKLLHEKLLVGVQAWLHVFRKDGYLAHVHDAQNRVIGGLSGAKEGYMSWSRVPWYTSMRLFTDGFSMLLLCFGVLRCLAPASLGVTRAELFPLAFVVIQFSAILLLLEAGPYYTYIIAFPLAWSAGSVLGRRQVSGTAEAQAGTLDQGFLSLLAWKQTAVVLCVMFVVLGLHVSLAAAMQDSGLAFLPVKARASTGEQVAAGRLSETRVHAALSLPATSGLVPKDRECGCEIVVPGAFRKSDRCCFLLSVDARSRNLYFPRSYWQSLPVEYVVEWDGREYLSGRLGDLHPPQMFCIDVGDAGGARPADLLLRVRLRAVGDFNVRDAGFLPAIAVEYPFNPDGDPRAALEVWRAAAREAAQIRDRSEE